MLLEDLRQAAKEARASAAIHLQVVPQELTVHIQRSREQPFCTINSKVRIVFKTDIDSIEVGDEISIRFDPFGGVVDVGAILGNLTSAKCIEAYLDSELSVLNGEIRGFHRLHSESQMPLDLSDFESASAERAETRPMPPSRPRF